MTERLPISIVLLLLACTPRPLHESRRATLSYEPKVVSLTGTMVKQVFAGRPNYEDVSLGDETEVCLILHLSHPADVEPGSAPLHMRETGITKVQLVLSNDLWAQAGRHINEVVRATGTLYHGHNGHHHTSILLTVTALESVP